MKPLDTRTMMKLAKKKNVGMVIMKAANGRFGAPNSVELLKGEFPEDSKLSLHQKLYAYALKQEGTTCVTVGIGETKHLMEAIALGQSI